MAFINKRSDGSVWVPEAGGYVKNGRVVSSNAEWTEAQEEKKYIKQRSSSKGSSSKKTSTKDLYDDEIDELMDEIKDLKKNAYKKISVAETIDKISPMPVAEIFDGANMDKMITVGAGLVFLSIILGLFRR